MSVIFWIIGLALVALFIAALITVSVLFRQDPWDGDQEREL